MSSYYPNSVYSLTESVKDIISVVDPNSLEVFQERLHWQTLSIKDQTRLLGVYEKSMALYHDGLKRCRK